MKDSRTHLSENVLELLSKNMNVSISELLWGNEENWKKLTSKHLLFNSF